MGEKSVKVGKYMSEHDPWGSLYFPDTEDSLRRDIERDIKLLIEDLNKLAKLNEEHSAIRDVVLRKVEDIKNMFRLAEVAFVDRKKKSERKNE